MLVISYLNEDCVLRSTQRSSMIGALFVGIFLFIGGSSALALLPANQPWVHVPGTCSTALEGAIFGLPSSGCGGDGTTFDTHQVFAPAILRDVASAVAPCPGIADGNICYRMWYVGDVTEGITRIGYAISPDGRTWTRVAGTAVGGSVLGPGPSGHFDSVGPAYMSVIKDGTIFKMWYAGYGQNYIEGIGYATSTNGTDWVRVPGALAQSAVLRPSGVIGRFDRHVVNAPFVLKDIASVAAPCPGITNGSTCYRMWYEGVNLEAGYTFRIGYATSPDGLHWTRILGAEAGAVVGRGLLHQFDDASVGVPRVIKDGVVYRMWYEAKDFASGRFTIGYAVSSDSHTWVRPIPSQPVWAGSNDPGSFTPDHVWAADLSKEGATYLMHYSMSTQPIAQRLGYARVTPGASFSALSTEHNGTAYTLHFTSAQPIPIGGSVLVTLPPQVAVDQIVPGSLSGFGNDTLVVMPAAVSDAEAHGITRSALLVQVTQEVAAGAKTLSFELATPLGVAPRAGWHATIQSFDALNVLEYGVFNLDTQTPTATPIPIPTQEPLPTAEPQKRYLPLIRTR